jgi:hypothetical protein
MEQASAKRNSNQVGPYTVLRKLRGLADGVGRMYAACHTGTGIPALLVVPKGKGHFHPAGDWQLRACASTSPAYLALEMEQAPSAAPVKQLAAGLDALTCALEGLEDNPEAAEHLATLRSVRATRTGRARTPYWAALACGVLLATLVLVLRTDSVPPPQEPPAEALALPVPLPAEPKASVLTGTVGPTARDDMPKQPFKGQKLAPCDTPLEVEMLGGCWVEISAKSPCPQKAYEHKGRCYLPAFEAPRENQSIRR